MYGIYHLRSQAKYDIVERVAILAACVHGAGPLSSFHAATRVNEADAS